MPHQSHRDVKGKPQPDGTDAKYRAEDAGQASGEANAKGQRMATQQGAEGTIDQAGGPARDNLQPEARRHERQPLPTAREEGNLPQTRVYEEQETD